MRLRPYGLGDSVIQMHLPRCALGTPAMPPELVRSRPSRQMTFRPSFDRFATPILDFANAKRLRLPISTIYRNAILLVFAALFVSLPSSAQTSILTQHYDTGRTGQ